MNTPLALKAYPEPDAATSVAIRIRPAIPADIDELVLLLNDLFTLEADFVPDIEKQRRGLTLMLDGNGDRTILVAKCDGGLAGMCSVQTLISTAEGGQVGILEDLIVSAPYRHKGIGRLLMTAIASWAREKGLLRLQLLADRDNDGALAFYKRIGWDKTRLICLRKKDE